MNRIALVAVALAAVASGCASVPGATSTLPAGAVGFEVNTLEAPEWESASVATCFENYPVEGFRRGFTYSFTTAATSTQDANRRLHICLQAATTQPVRVRLSREG
ncbi:MAG: hypothetical protein LC789_10830 [Actinobacteria bacterium]|nr:hypothetical protein [Actinomycetota bacterium]MCA1720917.1 hypothetical protein [Actinomycetota bacterium]